jgi:predicted transcriptional regulator
VNTYIGERYVPVVYGEWDEVIDYESLVIVTSNGSGYISKQAVPKGTPISNTEYWVLLYQGGTGGSVVTWESIIGKPTSFPSSWDSITGKPTNFPVAWESVSGKPSVFPSTWDSVSEKPDVFPSDWLKITNRPTLFNTTWGLVQDKPEIFPTNWDSISNKPETFPPSPHTHKQTDIEGLETSLNDIQTELNEHTESITELVNELNTWSDRIDDKADKSLENVSNTDFYNKGIACGLGGGSTPVSWDSITGKPSTFPPSAHTHSINEITNLTQTLSTINANITSIQSSISSINASLTEFNTRLTNTQNTVGQQTIAISNLQSNQNTFNTQLQNLSNSLTTKANVTLDNVDNETFKAKAVEAGVGGSATWDSITGKPSTFPTNWDLIADKPESFPVSWDDITGKPSSFPVSWNDIADKPSVFPPSAHTHTIQQIDTLDETLTALNDELVTTSNTAKNAYTIASGLEGNVMLLPSNAGSSGQWLKRNSHNQGTWTTLPSASASQAGLMSSTMYTKVNNTLRYVVAEGTSNSFTYREWSDGFVELWRTISLSNVSVNTTLGNMYRSGGPYTQTTYKYPYTFTSRPFVFATFFSTNSASAFVWLNPVLSYAKTYLPPLYLVRPTTGTCTGDLYFYVCGNT